MRVIRTPLVHFLAGGAGLFVLVHGWPRTGRADRVEPPAAIVLTANDVERLRSDYVRDTGLEPTSADEAALVDKAIDDELLFREAVARGLDQNDRSVRSWLVEQMKVLADDGADDADRLYQEARALGLDRTDLVVRRILVQKMRLLVARADETAPGDAVLAAFYAAHRDDYRAPDRLTFWHVFLASSVHGDATAADARALAARLRRDGVAPAVAVRAGDAFVAPPRLVAQSPAQLERLFGPAFAAAVARAEPGGWIGPVASPYGTHVVWIETREPGATPPLDAVRSRVLERWHDEQRARRVTALLHELRGRYPLAIESAAWRQRSAS
jgi:peptidyl-prolyl cis-trans isomerase C